ncbi:MAG: DUF1592 domain-containing protein [Myxococcota bacterium]
MGTGSWRLLAALLVSTGLLACDGTIDAPGGGTPLEPPVIGGGDDPPLCEGAACEDVPEEPVATSRIPRLTHTQWEKTVRDLFRLDAITGLARDFDPDAPAGSFSTNEGRLVMSAGLWQDYQRAAEQVAAMMTAPDQIARWAPGGSIQRDSLVAEFAPRAYRHPLTRDQSERLSTLFDEGARLYPELEPSIAGGRVVLEAILQAPRFVYRVEESLDGGDTTELDQYELASRLSYLLWGSMPDDALFAAAEAGELDENGLRFHAGRLYDDPRSSDMFEAFHLEHFDMSTWADVNKETEVFPDWREGLGDDMFAATQAFLDNIVRSNGTLRDMLLSRRAFVNEDLARVYGIEGISGDDLREVTLPESRAGILTRLSFLTYWSALRTPDPIHRGLFVNTNILCREVPPAPDITDLDLNFTGATNRERVASVTHEGSCASCHLTMINPPGFALESFDAIGAEQLVENGVPVDTLTTFGFEDGSQATVDGGVELSEAVAENPAAHRCYASNLLEFAFGRPVAGGDAPLIFRMAEGSRTGGFTVRDLIVELVTSRTFRLRTNQEGASE